MQEGDFNTGYEAAEEDMRLLDERDNVFGDTDQALGIHPRVDEQDQADEQPPEAPQPEPIIAGSFAIYPGPRGELVLVTDIPGRGIERKVFPRALVKLMMSGPLAAMLRKQLD
jgi:hypothetical protein